MVEADAVLELQRAVHDLEPRVVDGEGVRVARVGVGDDERPDLRPGRVLLHIVAEQLDQGRRAVGLVDAQLEGIGDRQAPLVAGGHRDLVTLGIVEARCAGDPAGRRVDGKEGRQVLGREGQAAVRSGSANAAAVSMLTAPFSAAVWSASGATRVGASFTSLTNTVTELVADRPARSVTVTSTWVLPKGMLSRSSPAPAATRSSSPTTVKRLSVVEKLSSSPVSGSKPTSVPTSAFGSFSATVWLSVRLTPVGARLPAATVSSNASAPTGRPDPWRSP